MSIKLQLPKMSDMRPRLTVMGIGGAGCNAINNMIASGLTGVDFIVANTDAQALASSSAELRVQLGATLTEGLGAGSKPEIGEAAAEEAIEDLKSHIAGSHMLFIAAGMGGGTGTGAAAVVARAARELDILTVAIVTRPFQFEGARRQRIADIGINELRQYVDTLIVIPNQNLFRVANERTTFAEAFILADQVLYSGVACIVDLIIKEGLINLDFADVRTVLSGMGTAMMGTGEASGERRAIEAAEEAIANPLLDDVSLRGARGLLLSISGGRELTLYEVDEAASRVRAEVDPEANIIVGATFDESLGDRVRVSIVASGMMRQNEVTREPPVHGHAHHSGIPLPGFAGSTTPPTQSRDGQSRDARDLPVRDDQYRSELSRNGLTQDPTAAFPSPTAVPHSADDTYRQSPAGGWSSDTHASHASQAPPVEPRSEFRPEPRFERRSEFDPSPSHSPTPHSLDEQALQQRLSAAIQMPDFDDEPEVNSYVQPRSDVREQWQGPGNVTIEEMPSKLSQPGLSSSSNRNGQGKPVRPEPVRLEEPIFTPGMPSDIKRQPRRVPEIDEFPQVAQREYRNRTEQAPQPSRKLGLFGRLGMTRRSDDSRVDQPPQGHQPVQDRAGPAGSGRQNAAHGPPRGAGASPSESMQAHDIEPSFRKDRR